MIADLVHVDPAEFLLPMVAQPLLNTHDNTLHNDHGTVDDDAEVDGTQTHEVGPYTEDTHEDKSEEQRQGYNGGCDDTTAHAAQEKHENEDDDEGTLYEVTGNGARRALDEVGTIKERLDLDIMRDGLLDTCHPLLDSGDDLI